MENKKVFNKMKRVEKSILYDKDKDTYYVHFNIGDYYKNDGFPTLELARQFRDQVVHERMELKMKTLQEIRYKQEEKLIAKRKEYPENLLDDIGLEIYQKCSEETIENVLGNLQSFLSLRLETCITLRYKNYLTFEEISKIDGTTKERIRQLCREALLKIKHALLRYEEAEREKRKLEEIRDIALREEQELTEYREKAFAFLKEHGKYGSEQELAFGKVNAYRKPTIEDVKLEELDLTVRSYNCLRRAGVESIKDICEMTENELMKVRNLGRKSFKEIINKLEERGLGLKDENSN